MTHTSVSILRRGLLILTEFFAIEDSCDELADGSVYLSRLELSHDSGTGDVTVG